MARREVQPGQRFQQVDSSSQWEVVDIAKDAEGIQHARLIRVGDATSRKTISLVALRDARLYKLVGD